MSDTTVSELERTVKAIRPLDEAEAEDQRNVLAWLVSGDPIYRTRKPATPPKHLVSYCVLVDRTRRSLLLVDHHDAGLWLATGGHVDVNEDPADAAQRELREELGVSSPWLNETDRAPIFVTVSATGGMSAGHTDVSLWYVFEGSEDDELHADPREFADVRWWPIEQIVHAAASRFDENLPRFVHKLRQQLT